MEERKLILAKFFDALHRHYSYVFQSELFMDWIDPALDVGLTETRKSFGYKFSHERICQLCDGCSQLGYVRTNQSLVGIYLCLYQIVRLT